MAKTLKLAFAMGGGVSLGSFSGAALAESIKQLVLHGGYFAKDKDFHRYENIEIDVFAGASAGAMALSIMLRGLAFQTPEEREAAISVLNAEGHHAEQMSGQQWRNLVAAQVVKNLQKEIWVDDINFDALLGDEQSEWDALHHEGGLLRRGALEEIARKHFKPNSGTEFDFSTRCILNKEVIFACTLSNVTGIVIDERRIGADHPNHAGLKDTLTSRCHKELRVFHLFFGEKNLQDLEQDRNKYPSRWMRYHLGHKAEGVVGELDRPKTWSRIVATAMACGAFPMAFEPVPLERFQFEYDKTWPKALDAEVCSAAMGAKQEAGALSYPFFYVDGGTFNNEPVKEAFRLASFLDAEEPREFDRLVVFVDPSVGDENINYQIPFLKQFGIVRAGDLSGFTKAQDVVRLSTIDRLLPHVGSLLSMIMNESRVKESAKIVDVAEVLKDAGKFYEVLEGLVNSQTDCSRYITEIVQLLNEISAARRSSEVVPGGPLTMKARLLRLCHKHPQQYGALLDHEDQFEAGLTQIPDQQLVMKAVLRLLVGELLQISGKSEDYKIMAIAPVKLEGEVYRSIDLPGSPLQGFAGFASKHPNIYAVELASFLVRKRLKTLKMVQETVSTGTEPQWSQEVEGQLFRSDLVKGLVKLDRRVTSMIRGSNILKIFPYLDNAALNLLSKFISKKITELSDEKVKGRSYQFVIEVESKKFELDGKNKFNDAQPVRLGNQLFLVTLAEAFLTGKGLQWSGVHVDQGELVVDKDGFIGDKSHCRVALPTAEMLKLADMMPMPCFVYRCIAEGDKGHTLAASGWQLRPGVRLIDNRLLSTDWTGSADADLARQWQHDPTAGIATVKIPLAVNIP